LIEQIKLKLKFSKFENCLIILSTILTPLIVSKAFGIPEDSG